MADHASRDFHSSDSAFRNALTDTFHSHFPGVFCPRDQSCAVRYQLSAIMQTAAARVLPPTQRRRDIFWDIGRKFLRDLGPIHPTNTYRDNYLRCEKTRRQRLQILLLFAWRVRTGEISPSKEPTGVGLDEAIRAVSSKFELEGYDDPQRRRPGQPANNFLLTSVTRAWRREDPAPRRV
jgi:hypothetical protein